MIPLSYSQYRIQQALYLQQENSKRLRTTHNTEQFILSCYITYLSISGIKGLAIKEMECHMDKLNYEYKCYDENIYNNIISIVDNIHSKHIKK